jgi:hypothetical protein
MGGKVDRGAIRSFSDFYLFHLLKKNSAHPYQLPQVNAPSFHYN